MTRDGDKPVVLHVIDSLDISGGAERQLASNLTYFDADKMTHHVVVLKDSPLARTEEVSGHATIHHLYDDQKTPNRLRTVSRLRRLVSAVRPGLIHASLPDSALATRLVARTGDVKAVESLVNISHEPVRMVDNPNVSKSKLWFHSGLDRLTMPALAGYHAVSQAVADSWVEVVKLDPARILVIPRGIEIEAMEHTLDEVDAFRASVRAEFGFPEDSHLAIAVGRIEPQKGHRYLVEATSLLHTRHPGLRVLIVGRAGHSSQSVETAIRVSGLSDVIRLTGARRDLPRLLAASDMFVFPSLFEGNGGNAMIEAMAAGLPIVTTGRAPMTDLIPNETIGLLVDRCDSGGLANALERLLNDPDLRDHLRRAASARARGFLTPSEVAERHEAWYLDLLSG